MLAAADGDCWSEGTEADLEMLQDGIVPASAASKLKGRAPEDDDAPHGVKENEGGSILVNGADTRRDRT